MVKIKKRNKGYLATGIVILVVLIISYFVKFAVADGANYATYDSLLGVLIFHNPFILGLYVLIAIIFIVNGVKRNG